MTPYFVLNTNNKRGFLLVEMIVSISIFSLVLVICVGVLLNIIDANKRAQSTQIVLDNLSYAVENMSRIIRTGSYYHCGTSGGLEDTIDCPSGDTYFAFEKEGGRRNESGDQVIYRLNNHRIERSEDGGASFFGITAPNVTIESLKFYVLGSSGSDTDQARVVIAINASVTGGVRKGASFGIQTTVSQRIFNN